MRRSRSTKILATLGPATSTPEQIRGLFDAGADAFRLNFSHGSHEQHAERYRLLRAIEADTRRPIAAVVDLQGPKLRIGQFREGPVQLERGARFRLDLADVPGDQSRVSLPHPEIFAAIGEGTELLLDDGKIRLRVVELAQDHAVAEVLSGGRLSERKGVNVPNAILPLSPLTDKDRRDLQFGLDLGADWIALSFVQRPDDVAEARRLIAGRAAIMVKIEKPAAVDHLEQIIDLADGIMVARGDLGVELPPEDVPGIQKRIVRAARAAGKPVVVATQMLESMIQAPAPTRAEASAVATAV
jgi:pyruvate kinase